LLQGVIRDETQAPETLASLAGVLGGNALSLTVAGLQLAAGHTPQEFLDQMPSLPPGPSNRVMAALMAAYRLLPQELQGMVMLIGTAFASGASEELLADVTGAPPEGLSARMRQLVARGFADEHAAYGQPCFVAHEMVQRFAQAFLRGKHRLDTMRARHLHAVPVYVRRHIDEPTPQHYQRLAVEMPTIIAAARYAATQGKIEYLRELTEMLAPTSEQSFVQAAGYTPEYEWLCHLLVAPGADKLGVLGWMTVSQAEPAPEPAESSVVAPTEEVVIPTEETPPAPTTTVAEAPAEVTAEAETAQSPAPPASPTPAEEPETSEPTVPPENSPVPLSTEPSVELPDSAEALERLGQTAREQDPQHLIARYAQAAQSFRADGKVEDELAALEALAMLSLEGERYEDVLAYVDQGMKLAQEADNPQREGELLVVLGDLQVTLERWEGAENAYKQAIAAFRPAGAWLNMGLALDKLGSVYWETARSQEAADTWEQAVPVFERLGRNDLLREVLSKVADTRAELLQWDSARIAGERLLALARAEGDRAAECEHLLWLGTLSESQGNREGAQQYYRAALHVAFGLGEADWQGQALLALARLLIDETVHLNRTLQLLEAAERLLPDDTEVQRLLKRAKTRQERLIRGGVTLPLASSSLQDYARQAYEALSLPD
jgi:tetratricopeptide (TPR) repeat protein